MKRNKYELPSMSFPYKITRRLNAMARSQRPVFDQTECMPAIGPTGVRVSALRGRASDRITEAAYPYLRRLIVIKRMFKERFTPQRLEKINRFIEIVNASMYTKLANCAIDLKKPENTKDRKKRNWTESEWKKHGEYLSIIAKPKPTFSPEPIDRGPRKPLVELLPRITALSECPETKIYKRLSQEDWYRDPEKVAPGALKYVISDRVKELSKPKEVPQPG